MVRLVPTKICIFAWRLYLDRFPIRFNLSKRGLDIPLLSCQICDSVAETVSHVFLTCLVVYDILTHVLRRWELPSITLSSYEDRLNWFKNLLLPKGVKDYLEGVFFVMWWCIWLFRNYFHFARAQPKKALLFDDIVA